MKNVYFLGVKKPAETVAYIHHFKICINPQLVNPLTIGNYPRKIDEYLASGKPVVATATPGHGNVQGLCDLCASKEDFVNSIRKFMNEPVWSSAEQIDKQKRICIVPFLGEFGRCNG